MRAEIGPENATNNGQLAEIAQFEKDVKLRFRSNLLTEAQLLEICTTPILTFRELKELISREEIDVRSFDRNNCLDE